MENEISIPQIIKNKIFTIRGVQVMLDRDLAELYNVTTGSLNQAIHRNKERFPENFMFQISQNELENLKSQIVISSWGGRRSLPYAFTEQGVAMLSGILKSDTAVKISIQIINAFVAMRKFIQSNAQIFQRLDHVETKQLEYQLKSDKNFEKIFNAIEDKSFKKKQGIFYDGQIFDAYNFVSDLIRTAKNSIILIDNYIDDSVLTLFSKCNKNVQVTIFTKEITKQLTLDLTKYNSQYTPIILKEFKQSHDRFIIIDDKEIYHIGASLKDIGKKWFAFSKFNKDAAEMIYKLNHKKT